MKNLIVLSFMLLLSACSGYDDTAAFKHLELPPYTETGANTFGCLVNGAVWANFGESYVKTELSTGRGRLVANKVRSSVYWNVLGMDSVFSVSAALSVLKDGTEIREEYMGITLPKNGNLKGVHQLNGSNHQFNYSNGMTYRDYYSLSRNPFTVIIKKDTIEGGRHIVSGTFSGILYSTYLVSGMLGGPVETDSLRVVAGVFDTTLSQPN
jgi:hypothetical protein